MINRTQIESILKINGVSATSPEDEIRSVLLSARYNKDEVDTALMVLRENKRTKKVRVDGLHKVFRTDEALRPEEISELLGIEVDPNMIGTPSSKSRDVSGIQTMLVTIFSIVVGLGGLLVYMYLNRVGLFHPTVF
jgi:hypothetical protein